MQLAQHYIIPLLFIICLSCVVVLAHVCVEYQSISSAACLSRNILDVKLMDLTYMGC
jgi:hypothetical protein